MFKCLCFSVFFLFGISESKIEVNLKRDFVDQEETITAVRSLAVRLLKENAKFFNISVDETIAFGKKDTFQIKKNENDVVVSIKGNSGVAAASGLQYYLKLCGCHISWDGDQLQLPISISQFPSVNVTMTARDEFRYYQNVCTASYSYVWWDWPRWQREIDWMALNGINLALASVGQEAVWHEVFSELGLSSDEINAFFAGPAFLAWNRMGNLRGWLGPIPKSWHEHTVELQKKIVKHMTALGITPVIPAFTGIVPRAFTRIFPLANVTNINKWNGFSDKYCCNYLLSATDPTFQKIGTAFLNKYKSIFGIFHIYNCDTFNENNPASGDLQYLSNIGRSIFQAMTSVDDEAVWLLQGWMFYNEENFWTAERTEAFLTSVPLGKMVILDLQSELNPQYERLHSYYGQPFIWCMLHNFGGTLGLHGAIDRINQVPYEVRKNNSYSMVGIGLTPEGINTNYIIYDFMLEVGWNHEPVDIEAWFKNYAQRRYGSVSSHLSDAWIHLRNSVYNYTSTVPEHGKYIVTSRPSLTLSKDVWYDEKDIYYALESFLKASEKIKLTGTFLYDITDVTRQSLQLLIDETYEDVVFAFNKKDIQEFRKKSNALKELLQNMEEILQSNKKFLLGTWIAKARRFGATEQEKNKYENNARNQITLWGPNGEIIDYASKQWSGLMKDYYGKRWNLFLSALQTSLEMGKAFNQTQVNSQMFELIEFPFANNISGYPTNPTGNTLQIANRIYRKWIKKL